MLADAASARRTLVESNHVSVSVPPDPIWNAIVDPLGE
jgi:hypothetical protein